MGYTAIRSTKLSFNRQVNEGLTLLALRVKVKVNSQKRNGDITMQDTYKAKIGDEGRIVLPLDWRKDVHANPGDELIIQVHNDGLHISTVQQAIERFQKLVAQHVPADVDLVDELIRERRAESEDDE
jgi:AbrB family looped-hinge helix DNA binding protein